MTRWPLSIAWVLLWGCGTSRGSDAGGPPCVPACRDGLVCERNACVPEACAQSSECPAAWSCISGHCSDLSCSPPCDASQVCVDQICLSPSASAPTCSAPYAACDSTVGVYCANFASDSSDCGGCGDVCAAGQVCDGTGRCSVQCVVGETLCAGRCYQLSTDNAHCGGCDSACAGGQVCSAGACSSTCAAPLSLCGTGASSHCADLQAEPADCGACGHRCSTGQTCALGSCLDDCQPPLLGCGSSCVDPTYDDQNCGACGASCSQRQRCLQATCVPCGLANDVCCTGEQCAGAGLTCEHELCVSDGGVDTTCGSPGPAGTFYLSPDGSDGNATNTQACPWRTFGHALRQLAPGDSLVLLDGTYGPGTSGPLDLACDAGIANGTALAPITIAALDERQAAIQAGDAGAPISVSGCAYWTFQGLEVEGADDPAATASGVVVVNDSRNLAVRRMAVSHPNRYSGAYGIELTSCANCLLEENEVYDFSLGGIRALYSTGLELRRNYLNGRWTALLDGGSAAYSNLGIGLYETANGLLENNVVEGAANGFLVFSNLLSDAGLSSGTRVLGNISLQPVWDGGGHATFGFSAQPDCQNVANATGLDCALSNTSFVDDLAVGAQESFLLWNPVATALINDTSINAQYGMGAGTLPENSGVSASFDILDCAAVGAYLGFINSMAGPVDSCDAYQDQSPYSGSAASNATDVSVPLNPNGCVAYLAPGSQLLTAGADGGPIGASIVGAYDGGVLTGGALWGPEGGFPCGALVAGLNDTDAGNCTDVNQRIGIGVPSCPVP